MTLLVNCGCVVYLAASQAMEEEDNATKLCAGSTPDDRSIGFHGEVLTMFALDWLLHREFSIEIRSTAYVTLQLAAGCSGQATLL